MAFTFDVPEEHCYEKAKKQATKAYRVALQKGTNPYPDVLDEVVPDHLSLAHVYIGLITIPLDRVAGTANHGRTNAFANNFMPLLEENSEFAIKWRNLYNGVYQDGVREPIKVLEYMSRYYVIEGNKRVSVSRYINAPMIEADVTRIIPHKSDDLATRIYYEYLEFNKDCKINYLEFSEAGSYDRLIELVGQKKGTPWTAEAEADFNGAFYRFSEEYKLAGLDLLKLTLADAFLIYLEVYGYDRNDLLVSSIIRNNLKAITGEFKTRAHDTSFSLLMSNQQQKPGLLSQFMRSVPAQLKIGFVNNRNAEVSGWTYWHELGKNHIESVFGDKIKTEMVNDVAPEDCKAAIERLIDDGTNIIFTTSPVLLNGAMKAAVGAPNVKVLNCSLLPLYHTVRSYYLRMFEAKYIIGAIAGAVAENNRIGYIADYPVYGIPASINAFAMGARLTNPRAEVYLAWSTDKNSDPDEIFKANDVHVISNRDIAAPAHNSHAFGLYYQNGDELRNLALPFWNWGRLYEDLVHRIRSGSWQADEAAGAQSLNYWWGMDANAIDVFYSGKLDAGTRRMTDILRHGIRDGHIVPFAETITDQESNIRCKPGQTLTPAEIIGIDWLAQNVIGTIPETEHLTDEAKAFVELQGIRSIKAPDASEMNWTNPFNLTDNK
ncbi:MAG: BMP family ABC transporter substrate-binding protein [Clostridia bacterium]|nr:BMP family ABC transporter substrate-binding protein [Clostridia bacterium]